MSRTNCIKVEHALIPAQSQDPSGCNGIRVMKLFAAAGKGRNLPAGSQGVWIAGKQHGAGAATLKRTPITGQVVRAPAETKGKKGHIGELDILCLPYLVHPTTAPPHTHYLWANALYHLVSNIVLPIRGAGISSSPPEKDFQYGNFGFFAAGATTNAVHCVDYICLLAMDIWKRQV